MRGAKVQTSKPPQLGILVRSNVDMFSCRFASGMRWVSIAAALTLAAPTGRHLASMVHRSGPAGFRIECVFLMKRFLRSCQDVRSGANSHSASGRAQYVKGRNNQTATRSIRMCRDMSGLVMSTCPKASHCTTTTTERVRVPGLSDFLTACAPCARGCGACGRGLPPRTAAAKCADSMF